jgi:hypothetical protein
MTARELLDAIIANDRIFTREQIDNFFRALMDDTLENKIAMELTPNDDGSAYTLPDGSVITQEVIE